LSAFDAATLALWILFKEKPCGHVVEACTRRLSIQRQKWGSARFTRVFTVELVLLHRTGDTRFHIGYVHVELPEGNSPFGTCV